MCLRALAAAALLPTGCQIFSSLTGQSITTGKPPLAPMSASKDSLQVEFVFLDRGPDDPLIGPKLWNEVDQVGSLSAETREMLRMSGIRLGLVGSSPPPALQTLLGQVAEIAATDTALKQKHGQRVMLLSGSDMTIFTSGVHQTCRIPKPGSQRDWQEFENAYCVVRLRAVRLQEGWVRWDFAPEIQHGEHSLRHQAQAAGWSLQHGQQIAVQQAQKFSLSLAEGDTVLMSCEMATQENLGGWFFGSPADGGTRQRLLLLRLVEDGKRTPIYQTTTVPSV